MTSQESGLLLQDFFTTEVRLFKADVDLALRGGLCLPAANMARSDDAAQQLPVHLDLSPSAPTALTGPLGDL
jgi:hypothetical protein